MQIKNAKLTELGQSEFQVQFKYKKEILQTPNLSNATTEGELTAIMRKMCEEYDVRRAESNLDVIKAFLAKDPIEI